MYKWLKIEEYHAIEYDTFQILSGNIDRDGLLWIHLDGWVSKRDRRDERIRTDGPSSSRRPRQT